ncbi:Indole-3-acetic acid-induced protein ARG7 [Hibiscus syriacus]|uniref:Indole-3-acetic acid-induced protein ARG7 n=1 Tax=Hibiscus syriacus TaxID=106335 RepID=A0A6A2WT18_HIBSY|nr:Indole-3-acetic acid-induced protein ARG7 [Hibiscus syriacus]
MGNQGGGESGGIRQFIRLNEILEKWHPEEKHGVFSPEINARLKHLTCYDSDEENCHGLEPPPDVPKGYLAVYVGMELRRFIIPTIYLSHPIFTILLEKEEEEFGYGHNGKLTLPCEIEKFKYLLKCIEDDPKDHHPHANSVSQQVQMN